MVPYSTARHFWLMPLTVKAVDSSLVQESPSQETGGNALQAGYLGFAPAGTENQKVCGPMLRRARKQIKQLLGPAVRQYRSGGREPTPAHWGLAVTPSGHLACDSVSLASLREKWGSPLHVVLARRLRENASEFLAVNGAGRTRAEVYYSYKSNPVPGVLQLLHGLGIGAEVISEYELWLALKLGVPANRIVFNGPAKSTAAIHDAVAQDLLLLNVNHREEIDVVAISRARAGQTPSYRHTRRRFLGMERAVRAVHRPG